MTPIEAGVWLERARQQLADVSQRPQSEAQALLSLVLEKPRTWVSAHPETLLSPAETVRLDALLGRLINGEPLPYLLGTWEFYGLEFYVSPAVLIPRPETELLVEAGLAWLEAHPACNRVADVGTGSGCIAISLAYYNRNILVNATDLYPPALEIAARNVARYSLQDRVRLEQSDLLAGLHGRFDLLCANLPYIPTDALNDLPVARFEPRTALDGGSQGLETIARLLDDLPRVMNSGSLVLLEIEAGQGQAAAALGYHHFPRASVQIVKDLSGRDRILRIE